MAFHYYHATALKPLRDKLYELLKSERRGLLPQTPQTVIVSNLDSEHYLRDYLLACDGVVMGVEFPFLEGALENFSDRVAANRAPLANENWFSAIPGNAEKTMAGMLELELALLAVVTDHANRPLLKALGYSLSEMNELQLVALAHKLALRFREYLLHMGDALDKNKTHEAARLWRLVREFLSGRKITSMLTHREFFITACKNFQMPKDRPAPQLYLFGLPILSAFHAGVLGALSGAAEVHLLSLDFSGAGNFHPAVKERYSAYVKILEGSASGFHSLEVAGTTASSPEIAIWSLAGTWRAAEILGDYWHDKLSQDADLRQDQNQAGLTALADDFAAFEKSLSDRMLTATSRTRIYEKAQPLSELIAILCDAQHSLDRNLVLRYWHNSAVAHAFALDSEKIALYRRALESAQGFRNDYPENQNVFNIREALCRLARGPLVPAAGSDLPAVPIREFETSETFSGFLQTLEPLLSGPSRLAEKKGQELFSALTEFLVACRFGTAAEIRQLTELLAKISRLSPPALSLAQLARLVARFYPPVSLKQGGGREGILFSALSSTPFTAEHIVLFDLGEKLDAVQESDPWLPEFDNAPTRLTRHEAILIALESARSSGARRLICAYSHIDPVTGAAKYPSQALGDFIAHLSSLGLEYEVRADFPATVLDSRKSASPPLASESDARTIALILNHGSGVELSKILLPHQGSLATRAAISVSELEELLLHPTRFMLGTSLPGDPELTEFLRTEPRLGAGKSARLQFAEDYLRAVIRDTSDGDIAAPADFIALRRRMGILPPEGFDETSALLERNGNAANLREFAAAERTTITLVEYTLSPDLDKAFAVRDAPRLERRYLRAPQINGIQISGTISGLMERNGELIFPLSALYPNRTLNLARAFLWMALIDSGAITLGAYAPPQSKAREDIIAMDFLPDLSLSAAQATGETTYLKKLLELPGSADIFWFDLALIAPNKLGSYGEASEAEICELLQDEPRGTDAAEAAYLRRFFDLKANTRSYAYFREFIAPIAALDVPKKAKRK